MSFPLLTIKGLLDGCGDLEIDRVLDLAVVDGDGRLLVSMIDLLAIARVAADADVLLVEFHGGTSHACRVSEILQHDGVFLQLQIPEQLGGERAWSCRLWSRRARPSATIVSISAMSFASFVGLE